MDTQYCWAEILSNMFKIENVWGKTTAFHFLHWYSQFLFRIFIFLVYLPSFLWSTWTCVHIRPSPMPMVGIYIDWTILIKLLLAIKFLTCETSVQFSVNVEIISHQGYHKQIKADVDISMIFMKNIIVKVTV